MRPIYVVWAASALAISLLVACGSSGGNVTEHHIARANDLCQVNGGVFNIQNALYLAETEYCGRSCERKTGTVTYQMRAVCRNGAEFQDTFSLWKKP